MRPAKQSPPLLNRLLQKPDESIAKNASMGVWFILKITGNWQPTTGNF